jgi:hypothetical protein
MEEFEFGFYYKGKMYTFETEERMNEVIEEIVDEEDLK